jgi:phosphocarrier protein
VSQEKPATRHAASFEIQNRLGLHARAAALLAETARRFQSQVMVSKDGRSVDAKSIMELLLLAANRGSFVHVTAEGTDAEAAVAAVGALIVARFGEAD